MVSGVEVYPVKLLLDVIHFVNTGNGILPTVVDQESLLSEAQHFPVDFKDLRGQQTAKRALEVACAGGVMGSPGDLEPGIGRSGLWDHLHLCRPDFQITR